MAESRFTLTWSALGALGAAWVIYDAFTANAVPNHAAEGLLADHRPLLCACTARAGSSAAILGDRASETAFWAYGGRASPRAPRPPRHALPGCCAKRPERGHDDALPRHPPAFPRPGWNCSMPAGGSPRPRHPGAASPRPDADPTRPRRACHSPSRRQHISPPQPARMGARATGCPAAAQTDPGKSQAIRGSRAAAHRPWPLSWRQPLDQSPEVVRNQKRHPSPSSRNGFGLRLQGTGASRGRPDRFSSACRFHRGDDNGTRGTEAFSLRETPLARLTRTIPAHVRPQ